MTKKKENKIFRKMFKVTDYAALILNSGVPLPSKPVYNGHLFKLIMAEKFGYHHLVTITKYMKYQIIINSP